MTKISLDKFVKRITGPLIVLLKKGSPKFNGVLKRNIVVILREILVSFHLEALEVPLRYDPLDPKYEYLWMHPHRDNKRHKGFIEFPLIFLI